MTPTNNNKQDDVERVIEKLAEIEHIRWSDWQKYCHQVLRKNLIDNPLLEAVLSRWDKQIATPYSELSETEKQSDRNEVERYLPIIRSLLNKREHFIK